MKRRNFVQSLLVAPATTIAAEQVAPTPPPAAPQTPTPAPATPARAAARPAQSVPKLNLVPPDTAAEPTTTFFTAPQFAALNKLAEVLMPPLKNHPGALDAHAPEFLDFLISRSPAPRQHLYRSGLDGLNAASQKRFQKPFAELEGLHIDAMIRPLLVARAWDKDEPKDPMQRFMTQVHGDLRTATMNSAEWFAVSGSSRGRFNSGRRMYWKPIDPRVGA